MLEKRILGHQVIHKQPVPLQPEQVPSQKNNWLKWVLGFIMIGALVCFGIVQFLKSSFLQIKNVDVLGVHTVDVGVVNNTIQQYLQNKNSIGLSRGNVVLFNKKKLSNHLLDQYASFLHVRTEFTDPYSLSVYVDEFTPQYLWCSYTCLFSDIHGYLYQYGADFTKGSFVIFRGNLAKPDFELRNNIFANETQRIYFEKLQNLLHDHGIEILEVRDINNENITIIFDRVNEKVLPSPAELRINQHDSLEHVGTMLDIIQRDSNFKNSLYQNSVLNYIDIRYPEKIFYKFSASPQQIINHNQQ